MTTGHLSHGLSQRAHRQLIGYLGLAMPVLLYLIAGFRPTDGLERWEVLCSVSAYYYTGATGVFTGILFALSLFLFSYKGYTGVIADRVVGSIGGAAALGVALFPTAAPPGLTPPTWWSDTTRVIHYLSALTLFASFILFAVWLFRRSTIPLRSARPAKKRHRDDICLACGVVMFGAVLWAASSLITNAPIFVPEAIAIGAFAVSWLVKGEAPEAFIEAFRAGMKKLK
jgi:heme A synthase